MKNLFEKFYDFFRDYCLGVKIFLIIKKNKDIE